MFSLIPMPVTMITSAVLWAMTRDVNKVKCTDVVAEIITERLFLPADAAFTALEKCISKYGIEAVTAVNSIMKSGDINTIGEVTAHTFASRAATNHYYKAIAIAVAVDGLNIGYEYLFSANADTQNADVLTVDESTDTIAVEVDSRVQNNASELHEFEL